MRNSRSTAAAAACCQATDDDCRKTQPHQGDVHVPLYVPENAAIFE
jgi:hypothetical protein